MGYEKTEEKSDFGIGSEQDSNNLTNRGIEKRHPLIEPKSFLRCLTKGMGNLQGTVSVVCSKTRRAQTKKGKPVQSRR